MIEKGDLSEKVELEKHHVMFGKGRRVKAEADGLTVMLCREHHHAVHHDSETRQWLCAVAQNAWEKNHRELYGKSVRQRWFERYGKYYSGTEGEYEHA